MCLVLYHALCVCANGVYEVCCVVWDEQRLKCYCVGATPVNYAQETRRRIEELKAMLA